MTAQQQAIREKLYNNSEVPEEILGVRLDGDQRDKLFYGEWSGIVENLDLPEGSVRDAKIKLSKSENGKMQIHLNFKKERLKIPDNIAGNKLTKKQKEELEDDKTVGPLKLEDKDIYLRVDKDLNRVIIKSAKEIGLLNKIGGYALTDQEKNLLANGERLNAKVYQGENGYFLANIKITDDKRGLEFTNIKSIGNEEAKNLIEKYNNPLDIKEQPGISPKTKKEEKTRGEETKNPSDRREANTIKDIVTAGFSNM